MGGGEVDEERCETGTKIEDFEEQHLSPLSTSASLRPRFDSDNETNEYVACTRGHVRHVRIQMAFSSQSKGEKTYIGGIYILYIFFPFHYHKFHDTCQVGNEIKEY